MLRLTPREPVETVWDSVLPPEVSTLPTDLARLDEILAHDAMLVPFRAYWDESAQSQGRPTIPMAIYVRLMVIKHRTGWGYETLVREVSDSLHLRRFCLLALHHRVPHESTLRKLTRRLGSGVVDELIRGLIVQGLRERRFRPRAMRVDSTVAEADIRYPTDIGLCGDAVGRLARAARRVRQALPTVVRRVQDRTRAVQRRIWALTRALRRRREKARDAAQRFTEPAARLLRRSLGEARRVLEEAKRRRSRSKGVTSRGRQRALRHLEETIALAERVVEQVRKRFAGEKIADRIVSLADPDARVIRRGKPAKANEFGYVVQFAEVTAHTRRGARGLILPPKVEPGSTHDNTLLPETVAELQTLGIRPREAAFDAGFTPKVAAGLLEPLGCEPFVVGSSNPRSQHTKRRLGRYRVGCEGRIAHVKRGYGAGRSKLRGTEGVRTWESWAVLAYDLDTLACMRAPS
jgi:IS5 family transposase